LALTCVASAIVPFMNVNGTARAEIGTSSASPSAIPPTSRGRPPRSRRTPSPPSAASRTIKPQNPSAGTGAACPQTIWPQLSPHIAALLVLGLRDPSRGFSDRTDRLQR
jgi:hypothetical protein